MMKNELIALYHIAIEWLLVFAQPSKKNEKFDQSTLKPIQRFGEVLCRLRPGIRIQLRARIAPLLIVFPRLRGLGGRKML
jgi:hypothetical protein